MPLGQDSGWCMKAIAIVEVQPAARHCLCTGPGSVLAPCTLLALMVCSLPLCRNLKMGVIEDQANRDTLASLLRFPSSKSGEDSTSFADYVGRCAPFVSRSSFSLAFVPLAWLGHRLSLDAHQL